MWVSGGFGDRRYSSRFLESGANDIAVGWVEFYKPCGASCLLAGDQCRTRASEWVQHNSGRVCVIDDCSFYKCNRFHGRMLSISLWTVELPNGVALPVGGGVCDDPGFHP